MNFMLGDTWILFNPIFNKMNMQSSFKFNLFINALFSGIPLIGELYLKELMSISPGYRIIIYVSIFIILNLTLIFIPKKNDAYFPRLNIDVLKERINRCITKHFQIPIDQVSLYSYSSKYFADSPAKYAVLFRLSWSRKDIKESESKNKAYENFAHLTGWCATRRELDFFHDLGIDASFADVYKDKPSEDFLYEWNFFCLLSNDKYPIGVAKNSPHLVLFNK